nr:bacteriophage protein of unknown function (DUF646) [uncultured bacterium]AMP54300.1 bacteriophage protein of unknown function (DUF646) [uncultured bacterium]AMP54376.1 bacteriophage protein of unknown function (DUF646) [uncultured bacterium]AMP54415.1 bacteriophage protein of unknown function (DUF646) [uncultured bacterium]AMP54466.1 bacteriophage protein of unknown function (DUF646) [uncultured bacterium]
MIVTRVVRTVYMVVAVSVTHVINRNLIRERLRRGMPLDQYMNRKAIMTESGAKRAIGHNPKRVDTGNLRASIGVRERTINGFPAKRIGTNVSYGGYINDGTIYIEASHFMERGLLAAFR